MLQKMAHLISRHVNMPLSDTKLPKRQWPKSVRAVRCQGPHFNDALPETESEVFCSIVYSLISAEFVVKTRRTTLQAMVDMNSSYGYKN